MAVDYGRDISGAVDITPTLLESTGDQLMREVICRRLYTPNCSLLSQPDETTCDLRDFVSSEQPLVAAEMSVIRSTISAALLADPRILSADVVLSFEADSNLLTVDITGFGAGGPFRLTLQVTRDNITVLQSA